MSSSNLKSLRESVSSWSSSKDNFDFGSSLAAATSKPAGKSESSHPSVGSSSRESTRVIGPARGPGPDAPADVFEREERREQERAHYKKERRDFRKQQELVSIAWCIV